MIKKVAVIGAGGWGTTLAKVAAENGFPVMLWAHEREVVESISQRHANELFLDGVELPTSIQPTNDIQEAVAGAEFIVLAVPSPFFRDIVKKVAKAAEGDHCIALSVVKGLEQGSLKTMSQVAAEEFGKKAIIAVLSGPNHAAEVSRKMPSATVVAGKDGKAIEAIRKVLGNEYFRVFLHDDPTGVEICGAVKNIAAIAIGVCDALGFGDNAKGSVITLGLTEMARIGRVYGAKRSTCYGLAGVGDLVATAFSKHSRNRFFGEQLGKGKTFEEISKLMKGSIAEGTQAVKAVYELSRVKKIDLPLATEIYKVIYEGKDLKSAIKEIISL